MGDPARVKVTGPLVGYTGGFHQELVRQGYRPGPQCDQLRLMAHVSRWMAERGLGIDELTPSRVDEFLAARRAAGYTLWLSPKGMAPLLAHLRELGAVPAPAPQVATTPAEQLVERFRAYLVTERGLAIATVQSYLHVARLFLATRPQVPGLGLGELTAAEVVEFVLGECRSRSAASAGHVPTGLRALLRFCDLDGLTTTPLAGAVPAAARRRPQLPKSLPPGDVVALMESCDRESTFGKRDFAVLTVLVRLGLRAGEVAGLRLDDVDWRAGELVVRGKGPKLGRLPLPVDVGRAIADWLSGGRPDCEAREVFTRVRAPHRRLSSAGVSAVVAAACKRAGVAEVHAHRLRHTAATEMLRAGAGLVEIGQVLRHESVLTTSIYAKVDRAGLRELAKPWPTTAAAR